MTSRTVILLSSQYSERIAVCVGMPFLVLAVRDMPDGTWHYSLIVAVVSDTLTSGHWNLMTSLCSALGSVIESWQYDSLALRA